MAEPTENEKPVGFQWPPQRLPASELNAPAAAMQAGTRHRIASRSSDVDDDPSTDDIDWSEPELSTWELEVDSSPASMPGDPDAGLQVSPPSGVIARWFEAFEIAYLGRVAASWDVRARDAGWRADAPGEYCPRCGVTVGEFELDTLSDPPTCTRCRNRRLAWDRFVRLGAYEGVLAGAIRELKFLAMRAHGERLGTLLGERVGAELNRLAVDARDVAVVPIPTTPWRRIARGVDHATIIARGVAKVTGAELVGALWRRHRPAQWSVPTSQRRTNVAGAFACRRNARRVAKKRLIVVVDDVRTTGATLSEACRVLRRSTTDLRAEASERPIILACTVAVVRVQAPREEHSG